MSEEKQGLPPQSEEAPIQPAKKGKGIILAAIAVIVIVVAGVGAYVYLNKGEKVPWLFEGAYADYEGGATVVFVPVNMKVHIEVVNYNSTHAKLLMHSEVEALGVTQTFDNTTWVNLKNENYLVSGKHPDKVYDKTIYIEGFGKRNCKVFEYKEENSVTRVYVDKQTIWPVKIELVDPDVGTIELTLKDTNIPGLKK